MRAVRLVLEAVDLDSAFQHALPALQRLHGKHDLVGGRGDDPRQLAHSGNHFRDVVERDERRGGIDRIHDVIERARERVNVFAIDRRHERLVQPLNDLVRQKIALVLDLTDLVCLIRDRRIGG